MLSFFYSKICNYLSIYTSIPKRINPLKSQVEALKKQNAALLVEEEDLRQILGSFVIYFYLFFIRQLICSSVARKPSSLVQRSRRKLGFNDNYRQKSKASAI